MMRVQQLEVACGVAEAAGQETSRATCSYADRRPWKKRNGYRYLTYSPGGFIQQLAVCYLRNGYRFYVLGTIAEGKDCLLIDEQILDRYDIRQTKDTRYHN